MAQLIHRIGDATEPTERGPIVIAHCVNDAGAWGRGFVMALSARWPQPERAYRAWHRDGVSDGIPFRLGAVQFVEVAPSVEVANIVGQHGIRRSRAKPPVRYAALQEGFGDVARHAALRGAAVHMPRIAVGLAGGLWNVIQPMIEQQIVARDVDVVIFTLRSESAAWGMGHQP